jgi:hypothetical protein
MNILTHPWTAVFFVGFVTYTAIRGMYARRLRGVESVHRQVDRLETALLLLVIPTSLLLPLLYLFTPLLWFADYRLASFVPWCGIAVMLGALWLFWERSHSALTSVASCACTFASATAPNERIPMTMSQTVNNPKKMPVIAPQTP